MATFTIELPDIVTRQIQRKGISQQQLETVFIRVIQLYLDETPAREDEQCSATATASQNIM